MSRPQKSPGRAALRVPESLFPGPETGMGLAGAAFTFAPPVGKEPELALPAEVVGVDREVPRGRTSSRPGPPQQPPADAALVGGDGRLASVGGEVVTQVQERLGGLDPCGRRDVAVADR